MSDACILTRNMKVGESISFDEGRIVVQLEERTGRDSARIRFVLAEDVVVSSKPVKGVCATPRTVRYVR